MGRTCCSGILCLVLITSAGCGKRPLQTTTTPIAAIPPSDSVPPAPPTPPPDAAPLPTVTAESEEDLFSKKTVEQLNADGVLGHVFFDLDQAVLRESDRATLQRNADWLRRWRTTRVAIEGHCDERGTAEYNLALGHRRAVAVRDYLVNLGVEPERVAALSKGKEQPFCREEAEECWQLNRRGHVVIVAK